MALRPSTITHMIQVGVAFVVWQAMYENGVQIGMIPITTQPARLKILRDHRYMVAARAILLAACFVAVRGVVLPIKVEVHNGCSILLRAAIQTTMDFARLSCSRPHDKMDWNELTAITTVCQYHAA